MRPAMKIAGRFRFRPAAFAMPAAAPVRGEMTD
jgi:hypothetical protein